MAKGPEMDLSSFMDIMTCILGILILIILLTGIDATQINVLVATPQEDTGDDKRPIFFECRNNELFLISFDKIKSIIDAKTEEIAGRVAGNESEFIKQAASTILKIDGQQIGFSHAMIGRYFLMPDPDVPGYRIENYRQEGSDSWYGSILAGINKETQFICFFVRPDSFRIFQIARGLAWVRDISVTCEMLDERDTINFGAEGFRVLPQ